MMSNAAGWLCRHPASVRLYLVTIMVWLEGSHGVHTEVAGLPVGEHRELCIELYQLQSRHFFVQVLGQHVYADRLFVLLRPQFDLRQYLVRKRTAHHVAWVSGTAP